MPIAAVAAGVGIVSGVANVGKTIFGGGGSTGGGGATGLSGGGGGVQSNEQGFYGSNASNPFYGVNVSSKPEGDSYKPPTTPTLHSSEAIKAKVANARETPTQAVGAQYASRDYQGVWADRLSRYLDYNTRSLG